MVNALAAGDASQTWSVHPECATTSENCPLSCQIKRILAITGMARKRTLHAINLIAPLALVATWFKVSVDAGADAGYSTSMILREF